MNILAEITLNFKQQKGNSQEIWIMPDKLDKQDKLEKLYLLTTF